MLQYAAKTDVGLVRQNNEDSFYTGCPLGGLENNLFIVADGMGGHKGGEYASRFVVRKIPDNLKAIGRKNGVLNALRDAVENTNRALNQLSLELDYLQGMGSTVVMAYFNKTEWIVVNVGDSRAYLFENDELRQITLDHSWVEEMVRQGVLERDDPMYLANRNKITRAMGSEATVEEDVFLVPAASGQRLLLCSDGLHGMVSDEDIAAVLRGEEDVDRAASRLLRMAMDAGGQDNITILLVEYREETESEE
ncbi:MAG: Stp1/IreP family PP2C-type Ser/Thr phosphatase [Lachnospiraceae bacterium]|nr:Stp1/IreP family PP2C-type Ser/Thr phosphatase [Lachnospiraceae bacterium]